MTDQSAMPLAAVATDATHDARWPSGADWAVPLDAARDLALSFLDKTGEARVAQPVSSDDMGQRFALRLPETGCAPEAAVREWFSRAEPGIVRTAGPRYFGFVMGGSTPAALAGDWLASALDQNGGSWIMSPAAAQTELTVVRWLLDLFDLPASWHGALTTGATMANFCGLAAARQWVSRRLGFDAARDGLGGHPSLRVISSTEVHQSAIKALGMLGLGRGAITRVPAPGGVIDLEAFERALSATHEPVIVIANASEVNTGAFDPIRAMADRCAAHEGGAWLHVDGAFGLYAALSPAHRQLLDGVALADSVAADAHKWLNVPYDCGVFFVRDREPLRAAFSVSADYLQEEKDAPWNALDYVPENSRRFRALSVWCALRAAGRAGMRDIVERSARNAQSFGDWVTAQPDLELLAPIHLNIVCFRAHRAGLDDAGNDALTTITLDHIQRDGTVFTTGTRWRGYTAIRAAFDNWATTQQDVIALQKAVRAAVTAAG